MQFILDHRAESLFQALRQFGQISLFHAEGMVYPAINGHPDVFITRIDDLWMIAPNTPKDIVELFENNGIVFMKGEKAVGFRYPDTARYNVYTDRDVAIVSRHCDNALLQLVQTKNVLVVNQGYIACNTFRIGDVFLTSDAGIEKELIAGGYTAAFVKPDRIILPGTSNGFIGGTLGKTNQMVFFSGSENCSYASLLSELCILAGSELVFLGKGEPVDVGGIIVL